MLRSERLLGAGDGAGAGAGKGAGMEEGKLPEYPAKDWPLVCASMVGMCTRRKGARVVMLRFCVSEWAVT